MCFVSMTEVALLFVPKCYAVMYGVEVASLEQTTTSATTAKTTKSETYAASSGGTGSVHSVFDSIMGMTPEEIRQFPDEGKRADQAKMEVKLQKLLEAVQDAKGNPKVAAYEVKPTAS